MSVVAVLGASKNPSRYSYMALELLKSYGHTPLPIHPTESDILGLRVFPNLDDLTKAKIVVDTLTIYVNPEISSILTDQILRLAPRRVIFNPGSENAKLETVLKEHHIEVENACTLVLLRTDQF